MHRENILKELTDYEMQHMPRFLASVVREEEERAMLQRFRNFINEYPSCFNRDLEVGHLTGSALVINAKGTHLVLTLHRKLNAWLQPGGHADGQSNIAEVALREAYEETGLTELRLAKIGEEILPIDMDIHVIPKSTNAPEHLHFDVRFLIIASDEKLTISDESQDLRWFSFAEAAAITAEESLARLIRKYLATQDLWH